MALQAPKLQTPSLGQGLSPVKAYPLGFSGGSAPGGVGAWAAAGTGRRAEGAAPIRVYFAALAALSTLMVVPSSVPVTVTLLPIRPFTLSKLSRS
jgi:hypothetical protein